MKCIHNDITDKLDTFIKLKRIPNIIFHGETGSGKKTILKSFLKKVYSGVDQYNQYIMKVNCSQGKGIKFIRDELKFFAKTNIHNLSGSIFKSIILLNAEKLTIDAQSALRRCIELFTKNTRFFIVIEDKSLLIKPILSRFCTIYIPRPILQNKITNLHSLNNIVYPTTFYRSQRKQITDVFALLDQDKEHCLFKISSMLYERGICALDIIQHINQHLEPCVEKFRILVYFEKLKNDIRNEKLLMQLILNIYYLRNKHNLENINIL